MTHKKALVAFGGNALIRSGQAGHQKQQIENAKEAAEMVVRLLAQGFQPIVVHGNGPQVGNVLIQQEEAGNRVPPYTMDFCGAQTQGSMGYMLQRSIENLLHMQQRAVAVATVLTEVVVDGRDPGFRFPSKPVGPYYEAFRAEQLEREKGWSVKEDAGRGWRRLVPSPKPVEIVQLPVIRRLVEAGVIVIACGGGGIPVVRDQHGFLLGVEAVIDKDLTSALLAQQLDVASLIVLTGVEKVYLDFGKPQQRAVDRMTVAEAEQHLADGQFPPGSMGPKIEAAIKFVKGGGREVLITTAEALLHQPIETVGTRVVAG